MAAQPDYPVAFNTKENIQALFPEELPINKDTLLTYCAAMMKGKLRSAQDSQEVARKALQSISPINFEQGHSQGCEPPAEPVKGVLEHFDDGSRGDKAVVKLSVATFEEDIFDKYEDKDVLPMLHAPCLCTMWSFRSIL